MSVTGLFFQISAAMGDKKRDAAIPLPSGVTECRNISYGSHGDDNLLDVCYPDGTTGALPTIVSIHGGAYVYGNKELYRRYAMDMAKRGFAFVNFNYRLAPKWKFPTPLADTNAVLEWICKNHHRYHLDPQRIILIGDSAGAQLTSQYAAMLTNPQHAALFGLKLPKIRVCALGLACGFYDVVSLASGSFRGIARDYLGKKFDLTDPRLDVLGAIGPDYPPAFITTGSQDFLREHAKPMYDHLTARGIPAQWKCYGAPENKTVVHDFHINLNLPEATLCNNDAAAFFKQYV